MMKKIVTAKEYAYLEKCLGKTVSENNRKGIVVDVDVDYGLLTIKYANSVMKVKFPDAFGNSGLRFEEADPEIEGIIRNHYYSAVVTEQTYDDLVNSYATRFNITRHDDSIVKKHDILKESPASNTVSPSQCDNCKLLKNGQCGGLGGECDDYEPLVVSSTHDPSLYRKKRGTTKYTKTGQSEYDDIGKDSISHYLK